MASRRKQGKKIKTKGGKERVEEEKKETTTKKRGKGKYTQIPRMNEE